MNRQQKSLFGMVVLITISLLSSSLRLDTGRAAARSGTEGLSPILEIYSDTLDQGYMAVAFNPGSASYLVTWTTQEDTNTQDLWARAVFLDGNLSPAFVIDSMAGMSLYAPALAADPGRGRFLVVYNLYSSGTITTLARTVNHNGSQIGPPITITSGTYISGSEPSVVYNPHTDEYLVIYDDSSDPGCANSRLFAVRINADSLIVGTPVEIGTCTANEYSYNGRVALRLESNKYQLVHARQDLATSTYYLLARQLSADLSQISAPVEMNNSVSNVDEALIASGIGSSLAVYLGRDPDGHMQIYGQLLDPGGALLGAPFQIPVTMNDPNGVWAPEVAFVGSLGYIVTWGVQQTSGDTTDDYFRLVPERPEPLHTPEQVLANGPNNQDMPRVACAVGMQCLMVFKDDTSTDTDIYGRFLFIDHQMLPIVRK